MTTETKVFLQNHTKILDLIFSCLTPRVKVCIHLENSSSLFPNEMTSVFSLFNSRKFWHIQLLISSMHWQRESMGLYCRAKAKDRNFNFGRKLVIDIVGTFETSFIMCISILSQFCCFSEKIMGGLNRNFKKPRGNQGRTPYNTSNGSFTLFGTLKLSYGVLPLFNCASK